ncbi:MAG: hypothetical protein V8T45_04125 [Oscillospiraceae bacterium]
MLVYIDEKFKCHQNAGAGLAPVETAFLMASVKILLRAIATFPRGRVG